MCISCVHIGSVFLEEMLATGGKTGDSVGCVVFYALKKCAQTFPLEFHCY